MPADHLAPPAAPCAGADPRRFTRLLTTAEADAHARGWGSPASVLRVEDAGGRLVVARRSAPGGAHPATALLGLRAPVSCVAVGVVAEGSARPVGAAGGDPGAGSARHEPVPGAGTTATPADGTGGADVGGRVRVAVLATRHGDVASVVRVDGDAPSVAVHRVKGGRRRARAGDHGAGPAPGSGRARASTETAGGAPTGRLVDVLLRVVGAPTAPPPTSTTRLWAILWLQAVAAVGRAAPGLPWPVVAALHPARRILAGDRPPSPGAMPEAPPATRPRSADATPDRPPAPRPPSPGAMPEAPPAPRPPVSGAMPDRPPACATPSPDAHHDAARAGRLPSPAAMPDRRRGCPRPAPSTGATGAPRDLDASVRSLVAAGTAVGGLVTWDRLHADAAAGRWLAPGLTAADAAWFDTGAFARWVLGELPPLRAAADAAADGLHPAVAATVDTILAAWHLDDRDAT